MKNWFFYLFYIYIYVCVCVREYIRFIDWKVKQMKAYSAIKPPFLRVTKHMVEWSIYGAKNFLQNARCRPRIESTKYSLIPSIIESSTKFRRDHCNIYFQVCISVYGLQLVIFFINILVHYITTAIGWYTLF